MIWVTRRNIHVDRTACAWLIRRFVDTDAEFVFVDDPHEVPAEATPFDMRGAELGHREGRCSFESILACYELDDPALVRIGRIVHEADIGDEIGSTKSRRRLVAGAFAMPGSETARRSPASNRVAHAPRQVPTGRPQRVAT